MKKSRAGKELISKFRSFSDILVNDLTISCDENFIERSILIIQFFV